MNNIALYRVTRIVWYVVYILEALLFGRFLLKMFGANPGAGFTDLVYSLSAVPLAPFRFVFGTDSVPGGVIEWSTLLAMLVYWFIGWAIIKFIVMHRPVGTHEASATLIEEDRS